MMPASCDIFDIIVFAMFLQNAYQTQKAHITGKNVEIHTSELFIQLQG